MRRIRIGLAENVAPRLDDCPQFDTSKVRARPIDVHELDSFACGCCPVRGIEQGMHRLTCSSLVQMFWRPAIHLKRNGQTFRIHARRLFHGKPRYDFVQVNNAHGGSWYGQVLALFDVKVEEENAYVTPGWVTMSLVRWLHQDAHPQIPGIPCFSFRDERPDVIFTDDIMRHVRLVTSPLPGTNGRARFVLLPYGRSARAR